MNGITVWMLFGFLLTLSQEQMASADWLNDLLSGINQMNQKLQTDIQRMNQQIHENVNSQVAQVNQNVNAQVARANKNIAEAVNNAKKGDFAQIPGTRSFNGGQSLIINSNGGNSRSIQSGTDANGQPFYVESENLVIGDTLIHTDRIYNYTSKSLEERRYTLNLTDPNAQPVYTDTIRTP